MHYKAEFNVQCYKHFNADCFGAKKVGGVIMFMNNDLGSAINSQVKIYQFTKIVQVEIRIDSASLIGSVIYRPPKLDSLRLKMIYDEIPKVSMLNNVCITSYINFRK